MYKLLLLAMYVIFIADMTRPVRFSPSFRRRAYSIINFLNTSEHIWTVRATRHGNTTCQFDHVRHVNFRRVFFNRTLMEGRTRHSVRLIGEFFEDNKSKMYVTTLGFRPMFSAKLIFAVEDNICGVMKLQSTTEHAHQFS
ncbi:uncharacterized protein LOC119165560 isoform X2 [Rhipicephalus microplus]|uniref:uncharacterized protein LOC119165560 isoform X2 n=1 Tax=Rhipicephalus microplus TaxID=6941 RepID=UPI003F6CB3C2